MRVVLAHLNNTPTLTFHLSLLPLQPRRLPDRGFVKASWLCFFLIYPLWKLFEDGAEQACV